MAKEQLDKRTAAPNTAPCDFLNAILQTPLINIPSSDTGTTCLFSRASVAHNSQIPEPVLLKQVNRMCHPILTPANNQLWQGPQSLVHRSSRPPLVCVVGCYPPGSDPNKSPRLAHFIRHNLAHMLRSGSSWLVNPRRLVSLTSNLSQRGKARQPAFSKLFPAFRPEDFSKLSVQGLLIRCYSRLLGPITNRIAPRPLH